MSGLSWIVFASFFLLCYKPITSSSSLYKNTSRHLCVQGDRLALLQLKTDLNLQNAWAEENDCCGWEGVRCNLLTGHVIWLNVANTSLGLGGTISPNSSLFLLHHLEVLDLSRNYIYSSLPSNISALSHLRYLNLSSNMIDGEIPIKINQLSRLTSLDRSNIYDLKMPDLDKIVQNMTLLTELHMSEVIINSSFPDSLTNLSSLVSLDLSWCLLKGNLPVYIGNLPRLQNLCLSGNTLSANFTTFHWSSPFRKLNLSDCDFTGSLTYLFGPTHSLEGLRLDGNYFYGSIPSWVLNISSYIDLSNNKFSGGLPLSVDQNRISGLTELQLSGNSLSGELPSWLYALTSLTDVNISGNQFSGQIHEFASDSLQTIDFRYNEFSGKVDLSSFTNHRNLSWLYLSNSGLSVVATTKNDDNLNSCSLLEVGLSSCNISIFPEVLRSCNASLQLLDLSMNSLGGEIPHWLREMPNLLLNLSYNHLVGNLGNVPQTVSILDIWSNMLGGRIPDFEQDFAMEYFDASNNQLSGEIPSSFCNMTILLLLDLSNNSLHGRFPTCLRFPYLRMLYLRSNQLHGVLPSNFSDCYNLTVLDLNGNRLEGPIPQSLARCQSMEVLDLGNNMFNHSFPYWLDSLLELQLLVLRNNNFHGVITASELCGFPLADCGEHSTSSAPSTKDGHKDGPDGIWDRNIFLVCWGVLSVFAGETCLANETHIKSRVHVDGTKKEARKEVPKEEKHCKKWIGEASEPHCRRCRFLFYLLVASSLAFHCP